MRSRRARRIRSDRTTDTTSGHPTNTVVDGLRLHAWVTGDARQGDVLLLPGLAVSAYLRPTATSLGDRGYRVWVLDPPGFGDSDDGPDGTYGVSRSATWAARWVTTRDLHLRGVVGQSLGTQVAAHLAAAIPTRVEALVLQGPTIDPAYRSAARALGRWLLDAPREDPAMGRTQLPEWRRAGARRMWQTFRSALDDEFEERLSVVRQPVLVVLGHGDPLARSAWALSLVAGRPERRFVSVRGPHCVPWTDPSGFADLTADFLEGA